MISLTNNYRLKYEAEPDYKNKSSIILEKNYLKKGNGMGGGRTFLAPSKKEIQKEESPNKIKSLVDKCFDHYQKGV